MTRIVKVGSYCPHEDCEQYGTVDKGNVTKYGKSKQGRQRYYCNSCKRVINENHGTIFYRKKKSAKDIIETLALLAKGSTVSAVVEAKGYKAETIEGWLLEASKHAEEINAILLEDYDLGPSQIDGMWNFVKNKGSKKGTKKAKNQVHSGVAPY